MLRFPRLFASTKVPLLAALLAFTTGSLHSIPAAAQEVIISSGPLVRKFPETPCPFPIELQFTATATTATIHAVANTYVFNGGNPIYANQGIDNIFLVAHSDYTAHSVPNNGDYNSCYQDVTVPTIFQFDQLAPGTAKFADTFALNASLWDLTQGAYFDATRSADNDPSDTSPPHDESGGSLGLGVQNATPSPADSARTSTTVIGLTVGQSYNLTGWWLVGNGIFTDQATLVIQVSGPGGTPITQKSWGRVKRGYR